MSSKIDVLQHLVPRMDKLIIGGGMANTFLLAQGMNIGKSLAEADLVETAKAILGKAKESGCEILLPLDAVVANTLSADVSCKTVHVCKATTLWLGCFLSKSHIWTLIF